MNRNIYLIVLTTLLFSLFSCNESSGPTSQRSSGKTAELLIVTDNNQIWDSYIGDTLHAFFSTYFVILPQPEPLFELAHSPLHVFKESKILKTHHNILMIDFNKEEAEVKIENVENRWANPQRVVRITCPDQDAFIDFFEKRKYDIYHLFMENEYNRLIRIFKDFQDIEVSEQLKKNHHLTVVVPEGFYISKEAANFVWIRKETEKDSQGIMIYYYDYTDTSAFVIDRILSYRNAITQEYIPGPTVNSYMIVADEFYTPSSEIIDVHGMYTVETHGLWEVEGDFMGGPFVNYTFLDEKNNRIIAFDGFVYKPNAKKRDMIIQLEAIFRTIEIY